MKSKPENTVPTGNCLHCHKPYNAPYARVRGPLGVCSKACEKAWEMTEEDGKHPQGENHVRTLPTQ